jgi:hypothetical protein
MKKLIVMLIVVCLASVSMANIILMDPTTNNGSFESGTTGWVSWSAGALTTVAPGYLGTPATDGAVSLNAAAFGAWGSNILSGSAINPGETITFTADYGWDNWTNAGLPIAATFYLHAINPSTGTGPVALQWTMTPVYTGFGSGVTPWISGGNSALWQTAWLGYDWQIVVAGGTTNTLFDNFQVSVTPEPATMVMLALGGLFLRRKK